MCIRIHVYACVYIDKYTCGFSFTLVKNSQSPARLPSCPPARPLVCPPACLVT